MEPATWRARRLSVLAGVAAALCLGPVRPAGATYTADDTLGRWNGRSTIAVVMRGVTSQVFQVEFQIQDVAGLCLYTGGQLPGGIDLASNAPPLRGAYSNRFTFALAGTVSGSVTVDVWGAWMLAPTGSFSGQCHVRENGRLVYSGLPFPPLHIDQHVDGTMRGGFLARRHFEFRSACVFSGKPLDDMVVYQTFEMTRSLPVPGDYDGDGRADAAMADGDGRWTLWFSSANYQPQGPFSLEDGLGQPLSGDFDGDGRADPVSVSAQGAWSVWFSSAGYRRMGPFPLGVAGGRPAAGDYDADGLADPAVLNANGSWDVWPSGSGYARRHLTLGSPAGIPMLADFDGDGRADPAVYRAGSWWIHFSSAQYRKMGPFALGAVFGIPAAHDFDGDGLADPAILDGDGFWHVWSSANAYRRFGPIPWRTP